MDETTYNNSTSNMSPKHGKGSIRIFGSFHEIKDNEVDGLAGGKYLYIETNKETTPAYIPSEEFSNLFSKAKSKPKASISLKKPQVVADIETSDEEEVGQKPDFQELMNFLIEKISIDFNDVQDEIVVVSDAGIFLELPWEDVIEKEIYIIRKIPNKNDQKISSENNLILFLSHAHEGIGENLKKRMDEEAKEIINTINLIIENEQQSFRMERVLLSKHTTKVSFREVSWDRYNYLHFIMHGLPDGKLCFENSDKTKYKTPDSMSASEFINVLKDKNLNLIFLSFCYSGGGLNGEEENIASRLIKNNASENVIGYSYPVGDVSASSFSKVFYEYLINGEDIISVYKDALKSYYGSRERAEYIPFLYTKDKTT